MNTAPPDTSARLTTGPGAGTAPADPRVDWTATHEDTPPALLHRRDGILPTIAAALSVRGTTLTCTGSKGDQPPASHALVQDFLDTLTTERRERHTGRCAEAVLLSRFLTRTEDARNEKRSSRKAKPLTHSEAKRALKHAKVTARHIREDGDPMHGSYAAPCTSCTALLSHFGVRAIDPGPKHKTEENR